MTKEILTAGVTDWVTGLEKVYARQTKQLEEHHANLRARDKALAEKKSKESLAKQLEGVAQFSSSLTKLNQARKKAEADKKEAAKEKFLANSVKFGTSTENYQAFSDEYKKVKETEKNEYAAFTQTLERLKDKDPKLYQSLKGLTAYEQIISTELMVKQLLNTMGDPSSMIEEFSTNKLEGDIAAYHEASDEKKLAMFNEWKTAKFSHFNLSDKFIANQLAPELQRQRTTKANNLRAKTLDSISNTEDDELLLNLHNGIIEQSIGKRFIDKVNHYKTLIDPETKLTPDGLTASQAAAADVSSTLTRLLLDEDVKFDITGLNQYLSENIEHPAGKDNTVFFTDKQINEMVAAAKLGMGKSEQRRQLGLAGQFQTILTNANTGVYENQEQYDTALKRLQNQGIKVTEEFKAAQNRKIGSNTKTVYDIENAKWQEIVRGGLHNIDQKKIDDIPNAQVQSWVQGIYDKLQEGRDQYNEGNNLNGSIASVVHKSRSKLPWVKGSTNHPVGDAIVNEIDRAAAPYELNLVLAQYDDQGNFTLDPDILFKVNKFKTDLFESRGGGTVGGDGLYSVTSNDEGSFENYELAQDLRKAGIREANTKLDETSAAYWMNGINQFRDLSKEEILKKIETQGGGFTLLDISGMLQTGDVSPKMLFYSDVLNVDLPSLIKSSIKRIKNDPNLDKRSKLLGLEEFETNVDKSEAATKKLNSDLDRIYNEHNPNSFKALEISDAQRLLKKGWHRLTPNQKIRIYTTLVDNREVDTSGLDNYDDRVETAQAALGRSDEDTEGETTLLEDKANQLQTAININKNQSTINADSFSAKPERTDEEIDEQFNAQPGVF